jgi:SAM-dependent methyltransferase
VTGYSVSRISQCRACGSPNPRAFLSLPPLPLTDAFLRTDGPREEFLHPIDIYLCDACGQAQTQHDVDAGAYYEDYQYSSAASGFASRFMNRLAQATFRRFGLQPGSRVIEVGSGDGAQLRAFQALGAKVLGFEPSAILCRASTAQGVPVINDLYLPGSEKRIPADMQPADIVLLTYTFDHLPDPVGFAESIKPILDPKRGVLIVEVHDFEKIFERREFCLFEHEHSIYCTASTLCSLLARAGFEPVDLSLLPEAERRANSLLVAAASKGSIWPSLAVPAWQDTREGKFENCRTFGQSVLNSIEKLKAYYAARRAEGARLAGYGAGGRGVMTLAASATDQDFLFVCDQNQAFHGMLTPGAHIPVAPPARINRAEVDEVIVFSFGYIDEIREQYANFLAQGGRITSLKDLL